MLARFILTCSDDFGYSVQQIAGCFDAKLHLPALCQLAGKRRECYAASFLVLLGIIYETVTRIHNKEIRITGSQNRISRVSVVKIVAPKRVGNPGHKDIVEADHIKTMLKAGMGVITPAIGPVARDYTPMKLRPVLRIVHKAEVARCL